MGELRGILMADVDLWGQCLSQLEDELPEQQFNTWLRPLQARITSDSLTLLAPNRFVLDSVKQKYYERISSLASQVAASAFAPSRSRATSSTTL